MSLGFNLHELATQVIGTSTYIYRKYNGRAVNDLGVYSDSFEPDETRTTGNVQPVKGSELLQYGLDSSRRYIKIYDSLNFTHVSAGNGSDQCVYGGQTYVILPETVNWFTEDGWSSSIWQQQA